MQSKFSGRFCCRYRLSNRPADLTSSSPVYPISLLLLSDRVANPNYHTDPDLLQDVYYWRLTTQNVGIQELSGTLTTNGQALPGNFQETVNFQEC